MATELDSLIRHDVEAGPSYEQELREVRSVAQRLLAHMNQPEVAALLAAANQPKRHSRDVQDVILPVAKELGFLDESKGLFGTLKTPGLRPDYFKPMGATGILLEVERGKTITNNMDLLDFWKCHLCERAHYLFLVVPSQLKHHEDDSPANAYRYVMTRLSTFFEPRNATNVRGLFVFGY